jgi:hypothetical protein
MFPLAAEELRAALNLPTPLRLRNAVGQFTLISCEIYLLGKVVPWLWRAVSFSPSLFESFADLAM